MANITYDLDAVFQATEDLEAAKRALIRETSIRYAMSETGEDRKTVTDMIGAMESMDQEGVLELTEGEPTTLADALSRYLEELGRSDGVVPRSRVGDDLSALLMYPWPGVPDADSLTREVHEAYLRLAPRYGVEVVPWDELEQYQRDLALAVINDLVARGTLSKRNQP